MNPCRDCIKIYGESLCADLGHCVFEGTDVNPFDENQGYEERLLITQ